MKITDYLLADHQKFHAMGQQLELLSKSMMGQNQPVIAEQVKQFKELLLQHAWIEDIFFLPAVMKIVKEGKSKTLTATFISHLTHEHKAIENYARQLEQEVNQQPMAFGWQQTFALLSMALQGHMRREEEQLFPPVEESLGSEELEKLGQSVVSLR